MSECRTKGGEGSAFFFDQQSGIPNKSGLLFEGSQEASGTSYFATVTKGCYVVRTKIVVSDVYITCFDFQSGVLNEMWSTTTNCYGGVKVVDDYVVAGDGVYRIENGERIVSILKEDVDFRTKSILYNDVLVVRKGAGQSISINIKSGEKSKVVTGPLETFDTINGIAIGVDTEKQEVVGTSLSTSCISWRFNINPLLVDSGWNLTQRIVPTCVHSGVCYMVVGEWLVLLDVLTGSLIHQFKYFDSNVQSALMKYYPDLVIGSQYHANQIATNGRNICLINYGHPGWIMLLNSDMKKQWIHVTSDQYAEAIVGDSVFTTSESFHRLYGLKAGNEIWKSESKSNCNNIFLFGESRICFENANGFVEIFEWE